MKQKILLKIENNSQKCRTKALKVVASEPGVETVAIQGEHKDQLVVTGVGIDAVKLTQLIRRKVGSTEIISEQIVEEKNKSKAALQSESWIPYSCVGPGKYGDYKNIYQGGHPQLQNQSKSEGSEAETTGEAIERKTDGEKLLHDNEIYSDEDPLQEMQIIKEAEWSLNKEKEDESLQENPPFYHFTHERELELTHLTHKHELTCFNCKLKIETGQRYCTCKTCPYYLHLDCSKRFPVSLRHTVADRNHDLILHSLPANTTFKCQACGEQVIGLSYNCPVCVTNYHIHCLNRPLSIMHQAHPHEFKLECSTPYKGVNAFLCDVCKTPVLNNWLYRCDKCELDVHLRCATAKQETQSQFQNQSESNNEGEMILRDITSSTNPSTGSPQINPKVEVAISCGNAIVPNRMLLDELHIEQDKQLSSESKDEAEMIHRDVSTATASGDPSTGSPQINPKTDVVGIRCGNAIAPNWRVGDFHIEQDKHVSSESKNESEMLMRDITGASSALKGSAGINPEVEVGITCGNIIAPKGMLHGYYNAPNKQVMSGDANQAQYHVDPLQVNPEMGTNVLVITERAVERKMDGMGKESDSTNPRIEPKPRSGCCCWFKCSWHCLI